MKLRLLSLAALAVLSTSAMAGGYWDYREICDYENVEIQTPVTYCNYAGNLYGWSNGYYTSRYFTASAFNVGHVTCSHSKYEVRYESVYNSSTQKWETIMFNGSLFLNNQSQTYTTTTQTQQVEGSCRMERVWIKLCDGCQIP